jgi:SAM-dependent methyltransferase
MRLEDVDWVSMWNETVIDHKGHSPDSWQSVKKRWDGMAPRFRKWMDVDDYPALLLEKIRLNPGCSVLDVGCGTGAISIPAARTAGHVTALDISSEMLRILAEDARKERLSNISCVNRSWDSMIVGKDIEPHDIVIASRSMGGSSDLWKALEKVDSVALRYVYVTAWGGGEHGHNKGVNTVLGRPVVDTPDYVYFFNILHRMGIRANIEHLECHSRLIYEDIDEAVESCTRDLAPLSAEDAKKVRDYLSRTLVQNDDGTVEAPDNRPVWSLLWWKKSG